MLPPLAELLAGLRVVQLPLAREFRGLQARELALFEGPSGWGEFAPFWDHSDEHAARWLQAAIEQAYGSWPAARRQRVPVNAIVPALSPAAAAEWVRDLVATGGYTVFKVKVGGDFAADVERLQAVRAAASAAGVAAPRLRADANGAWDLATATSQLPVLVSEFPELEYVEQPVASLADCARLRAETGVRIAVDEGLRLAAAPAQLADEVRAAADVLVLKAIPLGGVAPALDLAAAIGLPVVVSGSLDSSVGLAAGLQLAACLPELAGAAGLGTGALLAADVVAAPPRPTRGELPIGRLAPAPELLERFAAPADRGAAWRERLGRCHAILEQM